MLPDHSIAGSVKMFILRVQLWMICFLLQQVYSEDSLKWTKCTPLCSCATDDNNFMQARCTAVHQLPDAALNSLPNGLYSLSIQNSSIKRIPRNAFQGFENLQELILSNNGIQVIDQEAFKTFKNLRILDLRQNDIKSWRVGTSGVLSSLETIQVSGNKHWVPDENLLRLRSLKEVSGVTWSSHCTECTLLKTSEIKVIDDFSDLDFTNSTNGTMDDNSCPVTFDFFIHHEEVTYAKAYEFVKLGFSPQCLCISLECQDSELGYLYFKQLYYTPKRLFRTQYALGVVVFALNLTVVLVVLTSRSLRTNASFILICSMAMSDVLIGLYTFGIAVFNPFTESNVTPNQMMNNDINMCPYLGFVFTTGQTTTVFISLLLTIERYLAIVRCIRPRPKLQFKYSLGISTTIWIAGISYAVLPLLGVQELQYHKWFQCTMPFHKSTGVLDDTSTVTLVIAIGFVMVYVASVGLYLYIYFFFCKSTAHLAIRREARLAKRLSLVVCTNFLFFVVPTVLFLYYVYRFMDVLFDVGETFSSLRGFIIMGTWVPVTLLGVNSLLNPFMYAFRHQKFRREISRICRRLDRYFSQTVVTQGDVIKFQKKNSGNDDQKDHSNVIMLRREDHELRSL